MFVRYIILISFTAFSLWSCKKDSTPQDVLEKIQINTTMNGAPIEKKVAMEFEDDYQIVIDELRFYMSNISFITEDGKEMKAKMLPYPEQVFLYELNGKESFDISLSDLKYDSIKFDVGLTPVLNDMDPINFKFPHPLSWEHDMFWEMLKYRCFILEGQVNHPNTDQFSHVLNYHLGGDNYLRTVTLPLTLGMTKDANTFNVEFDISKIFKEIDWTVFFSFHSEGSQIETGLKMMDNISQSFQ